MMRKVGGLAVPERFVPGHHRPAIYKHFTCQKAAVRRVLRRDGGLAVAGGPSPTMCVIAAHLRVKLQRKNPRKSPDSEASRAGLEVADETRINVRQFSQSLPPGLSNLWNGSGVSHRQGALEDAERHLLINWAETDFLFSTFQSRRRGRYGESGNHNRTSRAHHGRLWRFDQGESR